MATKRGENEAFNTKRLPLPRLECFASREMALQNLGDAVHFWPSRRPKPKGPSPGDTGGALNIQDELQNMRAERGNAVADANVSFGAVDQAKKQVRASLALMRADASARRKQDNLSKQEKEVSILQKIKADWNTLRFKRKEKEEQVEHLTHQLASLGGDLEEDVVSLETLIPERDRLSAEALEMETELEQETRKGSMYLHMQQRARQTAEEASKEVDMLYSEVDSLDRDLEALAMYLRETRRLRAKSEEALNWMQENYNARSEEKADRLLKRREIRDEVGRELAETRIQLKELKAQWKLEADKKSMEEKMRQDKETALVRQAEQQEVAEEEMRVKLERLAHTVGLKHRPEGSKLRQPDDTISAEDDDGWTPESIMYALQSVTIKNEECKRQIDKLRERETRLWTSLPEWRTRLQAERQGWSEMWQRKLKQEVEPKHKRRGLGGPPGPSENVLSLENYESEMSEKKKLLGEKCKEEAQEQEKFVDSIRLLASVMTGLTDMERKIAESAPNVEPVPSEAGSVITGISSEDAFAARAKMLSDSASKDHQRTSLSQGTNRSTGSVGDELAIVTEGDQDELHPYLTLGEMLHRVMDSLKGICQAAELDIKTCRPDNSLKDVRPVGVKVLKVHQPLGIIYEKEVPGKYTTKEGYAVAGPHVNAEDDEDLDEEKFTKSKLKYSSPNDGSSTPRGGAKRPGGGGKA